MRVHLAAGLAMLALAGAAQAAPTWLNRVTLSEPADDGFGFDVAMDPAGNTTAVWSRFDGSEYQVQAAFRPAGGAFGAPQTLSGADTGASGGPRNAFYPEVAVDGGGNAVVVWQQFDGTTTVIRSAFRPAGGVSFGTPQNLSVSSTAVHASDPHIAMAANGTAEVVWTQFDNSRGINTIQASRRPAGGSFSNPEEISPAVAGRSAFEPEVAVDGQGDAVVVWRRFNGTVNVIEGRARANGSAPWAEVDTLSDGVTAGQFAVSPHVAITPHGRATAVWRRSDGSKTFIEFAVRPEGPPFDAQTFGAVGFASDAGAGFGSNAFNPRVAVDSEDAAVAVYAFRPTGGNFVLQSAVRPPGGDFGVPHDLSAPAETGFAPQVATSPQGDAVVVWQDSSGAGATLAVRRLKTGGFGAVQTLEAGDSSGTDRVVINGPPSVAVDDEGNAAAVFGRSLSAADDLTFTFEVRAAGFDAAPPAIGLLSVPPAATVGESVPMSVWATDRWSPVTVSWSFGDGGAAGGPSVSHAYLAPGAYTVTVTAEDAVGNAASTTRTVAVVPPPKPQALCVVPRLRGKTLRASRTALRRAHCALGKVRRAYSARVRKGHVISQRPRAGRRLAAGAKVRVVLSRGRRP